MVDVSMYVCIYYPGTRYPSRFDRLWIDRDIWFKLNIKF